MKKPTTPKLTFSQAIAGYDLYADARHLSIHTLADYHNTFRKFAATLPADLPISQITPDHVRGFLAAQTVSKKTILNYHAGLAALWTWAVKEGLAITHIVHEVEPPTPEKRAIVPFSEDDVRAMLNTIGHTRSYTRPGKVASRHSLPTSDRNRAIILLLLDTGMRASELCELPLRHCDLRNRQVKVFGKGSHERLLPICARTAQAIWRYCSQFRKDETVDRPLFVTQNDNPLDRDQLLKSLHRIGQRAGVLDTHPHRFRHTFAINYLRNGGDPWSLQMMLGHTTMEMVRRYLAIAQADLNASHRRASPVDNWKL